MFSLISIPKEAAKTIEDKDEHAVNDNIPSKPGSDLFSVAYAASFYFVNLLYTSMKVSITYCASSSVITEFMGRVS